MEIGLNLLTMLMRRVANNPFASARTKATKLTRLLRDQGYLIVYQDGMSRGPVDDAPVNTALEPTPDSVSDPAPLTRIQRARIFYNEEQWNELYELKRASKVYWDRLGFKAFEIDVIQANNPN